MASDDEIKVKLSLSGAREFARDAERVAKAVERIGRAARSGNSDLSGLSRRLDELTRSMRRAETQGRRLERRSRSLSDSLNRANNGTRRFDSSTRRAASSTSFFSRVVGRGGSALQSMGGFALAAGAALGTAAVAGTAFGLKTFSAMENAQVGFETMLGSAQAAQDHIEKMKKFANSTPFNFTDLQNYSAQLIAFGYSADKSLSILRSIGNASAGLGTGKEGLDRLTTVIGQIKAKGRVQSDELLQLYEARIPALDILSKASGKSKAQVQADVTAGIVPAEQSIEAILKYFDTRFGGLMDKQSHTLGGLWSNFVDLTQQASADAVKPLALELEKGLPAASKMAAGAIRGTAGAFSWLIGKARPVFPVLRELYQAFKLGGADLLFNQLDNKLGTKGGFVKTWHDVLDLATSVKNLWIKVLWPLLKYAGPIAMHVVEVITRGVRVLADLITFLGPAISPILRDILDTVEAITVAADVVVRVLDFSVQTGEGVKNAVTHPKAALKGDIPMPDAVRNFSNWGRSKLGLAPIKPANQAKGGHTTRSGLSWVGEHGPELLQMPRGATVRPLNPSDGGKMSTGDTYMISVDAADYLKGEAVANAVVKAIQTQIARR